MPPVPSGAVAFLFLLPEAMLVVLLVWVHFILALPYIAEDFTFDIGLGRFRHGLYRHLRIADTILFR